MSGSNLTTTQAAERLNVGKSTVNLWCRQGRFPNAYAVEEARGSVWYIPESDIVGFTPPPMGRPKKVPPVETAAKKTRGRPRKSREAKP